MEINPKEVNGRISLLMQKLAGNQKQFAALLGVTQPAVSKYLSGRIPPPEVLLKMAGASGTTIEWILTGKNLPVAGRISEPTARYHGMISLDDKLALLPVALQKRFIALLDTLLESLVMHQERDTDQNRHGQGS